MPDLFFGNLLSDPKPKSAKKRSLTPAQKAWAWDHTSHTCNICGKRVPKLTEAEFDHTRAHSKGGATNLSNVKIVHRSCNRLKGNKSLGETKKLLGIKSKKRVKKKVAKRAKVANVVKAARKKAPKRDLFDLDLNW